ncbi:MAG: 4Fe-4S ferredoxin [Gammaproteobacteria bacterium]|nr:MAG: 4Fe-4S ferredoxin [Gammaproteobacteria bacterium]
MNKLNRREFIKKTTNTAAISILPGVFLQTVNAKGADVKNRWGMLIDTRGCGDCKNECITACHSEHAVKSFDRPQTDSQWIRKVTVKNRKTSHTMALPIMCQHCEKPACVDVCPTGASFKRVDGIVLVDRHICIGCRYCMMACPYKARNFVHENLSEQNTISPRGKGTVEACTMCVHRIDKDGAKAKTACQQACPKNSIIFGDLNDKNSGISKKLKAMGARQIRADLNLNPAVLYQGLDL